MSLYTLSQVKHCYGLRTVLAIEHLDIEAGAIHALLGPNGAGKTTLLHLLAFLASPTSGVLSFQGTPVVPSPTAMLALRRQVVLVDQQPIMFSTTVAANMEFGLKIRQIPKKERQRKVDEALELTGLSRYKMAAAHALSGGETQRLALARALVLTPTVLLCDEPTASVDAEHQAVITSLLQEVNRTFGTTILFTTHDRLQAASLAQQTITLEQGRLATPAQENSFTAIVHPASDGGLCCQLRGGTELLLPAPSSLPPLPVTCQINLHPERIRLVRLDDPVASPDARTGTVQLLLAEGRNQVRLVIDIGVPLVVLLSTHDHARLRPSIGDRFRLDLPPDAITLAPAPGLNP